VKAEHGRVGQYFCVRYARILEATGSGHLKRGD
jgi:hypothetical protein